MRDVSVISVVNSFSIISDGLNSLWIDPWVNPANAGAWAPLIQNENYSALDEIFLKTLPDWVFISHMHTDHYDIRFLQHIKKRNPAVKFFIKKFSSKVFYKKITSHLSPDSVFEIEQFTETNLASFSIVVIPQYNNSSSSEFSSVDFDLDTSLIIKTEHGLIFNEIDNPLKLKDYPFIYSQLPISYRESPKVALIGFSSASEFPQSYFDIDRLKERENLINKSTARFYEVAEFLGAPVVIPAGGNYLLNGFLNSLNEFTAVPSFNELLARKNGQSMLVVDPTNQFVKLSKNGPNILNRTDKLPKIASVDEEFSVEKYFLSDKNIIDASEVQSALIQLESQADERLRDLFKKLKTTINFCVTKDFLGYSDISIIEENVLFKHTVFDGGQSKIILDIYCSYKLLWCMISSQESWNDLYFLCLMRRSPNIHEPDAVRALNFYRIPRLKH